MPNWTAEQRQAIDDRSRETLVSAAAGSGKTAVLIEHVLTLLRQGGRVDRLLIITFTRAAAAELRERLSAALEREAASPHMRRQRLALRRAQISTLHVFCHRLLRRYFQAALVDPMAKVGDTTVLEPLLQRAVDESMEELCQREDGDARALTAQYGDGQIVDMARQLYGFLRAQPHPWQWLEEKLRDPAGEGLTPFLEMLRREQALTLAGARQLSDLSLTLLARPGAPAYLLPTAQSDRALIEAAAEAAAAGQPLPEPHFAVRARAPRGAECDEALLNRFLTLRERIKALLNDACALVPADLEAARGEVAFTLPALRALANLTRAIDARYAQYKEEKNLLDYGDLEHKALLALEDAGVREAAAGAFDAIFVDEYQDVSAIQEAIVSRIHNEGNRLFLVGDVKQSIYRFRLADPTLFLEKYARYGGAADGSRRILLSSNFRSRGNILRAVNAVFARAMRSAVTEIDYDEAARLRPGLETKGDPPVELHVIAGEEEDGEGEIKRGWMYEAQLAAARIQALVGTPVLENGRERPLRYRDCVILLRSASGRAPHIARILAEAGVPAYSDADGQYFELPEVRDVMNVLRVLDNPYQDVALLSALRCPCFGFSSERLARIRLTDGTRQKPFYEVFFALRERDEDVRRACETLDSWRFLSQHMPVDALLYRLLRLSGLYARAGAQRDGAARQANLRLLCERAQAEGARYALSDFLRVSDLAQRTGEAGAARQVSENDDVVRIMTLHKSKGLEFPVVILMELARAFRMPSQGELLRCDAAAGLALKRCDDQTRETGHTLCGRALGYQKRREIRAEEARLLYVGMTRARERLILLSSPRSLESARAVWSLPPGDSAAAAARCMLDWIGQTVYEGLTGGETDYRHENGSEWHVCFHSGGEFRQQLPPERPFEAPDGSQPPDPALAARFQARAYRTRRLKTSVTALLRERLDEGEEETIESKRRALRLDTLPDPLPDFSAPKTTAADRGTAMHKALCALDLTQPIEGQLERMEREGRLTAEERALLRVGDLQAFARSPLGTRALRAQTMRREWGFCLMHEGTVVQGVLDLCFWEADGWVIVDYKTDRCGADRLPEMYGEQLRWYARALSEITGAQTKELWLYSLREGRAVPVENFSSPKGGETPAETV